MMGATLPGVPSVMMGRTPYLSWAGTYGYMDVIDYFIEDVQDKNYRRGDQWRPFNVREEIIKPKKKNPINLKFYENEHGILEGEPDENGYYLSFAWSAHKNTAAESINNYLKVPQAKNAGEAMNYFAGLSIGAFNWTMADTGGNIGYQLSGLFPQKAENTSGLLPYLGWDANHDWQGMISPNKYPQTFNPEDGIIITANQDLNRLGQVAPMTIPMADYRADRIRELLNNKERLTSDDMKQVHYDRYSKQAEAFMEIIRPLLPSTENGDILKKWDKKYDSASLGATLFERIYLELMKLVFGKNGMGVDVVVHMITDTSIFVMLHGKFDQVLLKKRSAWFGDLSRDRIYQTAIERGLQKPAVPYGRTRETYIPNIFFAGQLPKIFGFDYGPYEHIGSRATVAQSQMFKAMGHPATFVAVYRMIADMDTDELHTNNAGGPSDRRFSKYYTMGISDWINARYHLYKP
jgi:penicillin amidase